MFPSPGQVLFTVEAQSSKFDQIPNDLRALFQVTTTRFAKDFRELQSCGSFICFSMADLHYRKPYAKECSNASRFASGTWFFQPAFLIMYDRTRSCHKNL